jgi:putative selenium metabolism hydrolase
MMTLQNSGKEEKVIINEIVAEIKNDLVGLAQQLIQIQSFTQDEEAVIRFVKVKMIELGYDEVFIDEIGNVIGVIGDGDTKILFDSHTDTVRTGDIEKWTKDPFGGEIVDGKLYGRGSVDMKSALAASIYAGYAMKRWGMAKDKTIYVVASVMEEDFDGEALNWILKEKVVEPDYVVICEPSSLNLALGHRGRALIKISTSGVSSHGSEPDKGINAVYKVPKIIERVELLQKYFSESPDLGGSVAVTRIESESVSLNAVPTMCSVYLDRRLAMGEDEDYIRHEMEKLLEGMDAKWEIYDEYGTSWTGKDVVLRSFLPAWEMKSSDPIVRYAQNALDGLDQNGKLIKWDFCTNGVASAGMHHIPTIGYGPGSPEMAHKTDEYCPVEDIIKAFKFYTVLPDKIES